MKLGYLIFCLLFQKLGSWYQFTLQRRLSISGDFSSFPPLSMLHSLWNQSLKHYGVCVVLSFGNPKFWSLIFLFLKSNSQRPSSSAFVFLWRSVYLLFLITPKLSEPTVDMLFPLTVLNSLKLVSKYLTPRVLLLSRTLSLWRKKRNLNSFWNDLWDSVFRYRHQIPQLNSSSQ